MNMTNKEYQRNGNLQCVLFLGRGSRIIIYVLYIKIGNRITNYQLYYNMRLVLFQYGL